MDNRTDVREDPLEDPRLDAGAERPEILAFQEALQILERVRGSVYAAAASTLERTVEFVQGILPFYATVCILLQQPVAVIDPRAGADVTGRPVPRRRHPRAPGERRDHAQARASHLPS